MVSFLNPMGSLARISVPAPDHIVEHEDIGMTGLWHIMG